MAIADYLLSLSGIFLEGIIVWRGLRLRLWRHYPYFYSYMGYILVLNISLLLLAQLKFPAYALAYWRGNAVAVLLAFLIPWEVSRHTLALSPSIRLVLGQLLGLVLISVALVLFVGSTKPGSIFIHLERKADLAQAVWLATVLFLIRYYGIALERNIWGMALGFGVFAGVSVMNFTALELASSYFPLLRYIRPISYLSTLCIWTWALWSYAPNPIPNFTSPPESTFNQYRLAWSQLRTSLRKVLGL